MECEGMNVPGEVLCLFFDLLKHDDKYHLIACEFVCRSWRQMVRGYMDRKSGDERDKDYYMTFLCQRRYINLMEWALHLGAPISARDAISDLKILRWFSSQKIQFQLCNLESAAIIGDLDSMEYILSVCPSLQIGQPEVSRGIPSSLASVYVAAAGAGMITSIEWLFNHEARARDITKFKLMHYSLWIKSAICRAISNGQLIVLKYFDKEAFIRLDYLGDYLLEAMCSQQLIMIDWLLCPPAWARKISEHWRLQLSRIELWPAVLIRIYLLRALGDIPEYLTPEQQSWTCAMCARFGNVSALQALINKNYHWDERVKQYAEIYNQDAILKFIGM